MKWLITSVASLVGQNILDVLEYPEFSRRSLVNIVGLNSLPDSAGNFRCDRCYLVPPTGSAEYSSRICEILYEESPDLILCGRDEDTLVLSRLKREHPDLPGALPCADPHAALVGIDKWQTWLFTRRHGLPFAESFMVGEPCIDADLETFCRRVGYPLIAKPVRGFASRGVCFVRHAAEAQSIARQRDFLFQEYLGDPRELEPYFAGLQGPIPLFACAPGTGHYSCQTMIAPDGQITPVFISHHPQEYGRSLCNRRVSDSALAELTEAYARAFVAEGGAGPLNLGFRRDREGRWKVQEINLRHTGSTFARLLLDFDELYYSVRDFVPGATFPKFASGKSERFNRVDQYRYTYAIPDSAVAALESSGVWSRT